MRIENDNDYKKIPVTEHVARTERLDEILTGISIRAKTRYYNYCIGHINSNTTETENKKISINKKISNKKISNKKISNKKISNKRTLTPRLAYF